MDTDKVRGHYETSVTNSKGARAADEDNIVRFCGVLSSDDDRTLEELAEIPGEISKSTSMFFPSITDSGGMQNLNDEELWFKVTQGLEFSPDNIAKATMRLARARGAMACEMIARHYGASVMVFKGEPVEF